MNGEKRESRQVNSRGSQEKAKKEEGETEEEDIIGDEMI